VAANSRSLVDGQFIPCSPPRALRADEIPGIVADYAHAARCAMDAGFDGVEVHAANGYLIEQFLRDSINDRSDEWGGSIEHRTQFLVDVVQAVAAAAGPGRTGIRLSPVTPANDAGPDSDPQALYGRAVERIAPLKLAYLHVVEGSTGGPRDIAPFDYEALRRAFSGAWMVNNGYDAAMAVGGRGRRPRRPRRLRPALHPQPRPRPAPARGLAAGHGRPQGLLQRRRGGLHRLPGLA
jgi:N-ethylmaleimide reductase